MVLANSKGYSKIGFFLMGFFLNVIGLIVAIFLPSRNGSNKDTGSDA